MDIEVDKKELEKQLFEEAESQEGSIIIKLVVPEVDINGLDKVDIYSTIRGDKVSSLTEAMTLCALEQITNEFLKNPDTKLLFEMLKASDKIKQFRYDFKKGEKDE